MRQPKACRDLNVCGNDRKMARLDAGQRLGVTVWHTLQWGDCLIKQLQPTTFTATASQVEIYPCINHGLREYDHVTGRKSLHPGEK